MDKTLMWLLVPGLLAIYAFVRVSARHRQLSYDLEAYFLAGKKLTTARFALATSTVSLLGLMALPHMGLLYRSGFSYGFLALGTIVMAATSALFGRRLWNLATLFNPLTPSHLLGDYYRSRALRLLVTLVAVLIAFCLIIMTLRLSLDLLQGLLGALDQGVVPGTRSKIAYTTMFFLTALLFILAAFGGMGAILSLAAPIGLAILIALPVALLIALTNLSDWSVLYDGFTQLAESARGTAPLATSDFFETGVPAAPLNRAWPGLMVVSALLAFIGLALSPAALMSSFSARKGQSLAPQQFFTTALLIGLLVLVPLLGIAMLSYFKPAPLLLSLDPRYLANKNWDLVAGLEPQMIMRMLRMSPLGAPLALSLIALTLLAGLLVSSAAAVLAAGAMISGELSDRKRRTVRAANRTKITRFAIAAILLTCLVLTLLKPADPLPLFLLAGAFGLQLLPAFLGLCYFKKLTAPTVLFGALIGLLAVLATSSLAQGLAELFGLTLPFAAWPHSIHPALWGLAANLCALFVAGLIKSPFKNSEKSKKALAHRQSWHVLPDGQPIMPAGASKWRFLALVLFFLFSAALALPLSGVDIPELPKLSLWSWQFLAWFIGLGLVYVIAYRLQPTFDPEQALEGSPDPLNRRFRVKAQVRKAPTQDTVTQDNEVGKI